MTQCTQPALTRLRSFSRGGGGDYGFVGVPATGQYTAGITDWLGRKSKDSGRCLSKCAADPGFHSGYISRVDMKQRCDEVVAGTVEASNRQLGSLVELTHGSLIPRPVDSKPLHSGD